LRKELDKVSSTDVKPSDMKNQLVENLVNIGKEYAEDDEKYFPLSKLTNTKLNIQSGLEYLMENFPFFY
jgi:hypothetical protein